MPPRLGLLPRIAIYVTSGLLAVAVASTAARQGRIVDEIVRVGLIVGIGTFVAFVVRSNGSRLFKAVKRLRSSDPIFEIVRSDGNESDVRVLGLSGPGLNRLFVVVLADRGLEVWVDGTRDQPSLTIPWHDISSTGISTLPFREGLLRPSIDAVVVEVDGRDPIDLALVPASRALGYRSRSEALRRLHEALDRRTGPSATRR